MSAPGCASPPSASTRAAPTCRCARRSRCCSPTRSPGRRHATPLPVDDPTEPARRSALRVRHRAGPHADARRPDARPARSPRPPARRAADDAGALAGGGAAGRRMGQLPPAVDHVTLRRHRAGVRPPGLAAAGAGGAAGLPGAARLAGRLPPAPAGAAGGVARRPAGRRGRRAGGTVAAAPRPGGLGRRARRRLRQPLRRRARKLRRRRHPSHRGGRRPRRPAPADRPLRRPPRGDGRAGGDRRASPPLPGRATDLALAVGFGAGLVDTSAIPRLLLLSDGLATRGDLATAAARLAERQLPLYAVAPPTAEAGDVAIVELAAPDDVRPRLPFRVDVRLLADRAGTGTVRLSADGSGRAIIDEPERTLAIPAGTTTVSFTARIAEPGITTLRAQMTAAPRRPPPRERRGGAGDRHPARAARPVLEGASGVAGPVRARAGARADRRRRPPGRAPPGTSSSAATTWWCWPTSRAPRSATRRWSRSTASCATAAACWSPAARRASAPAATPARAWRRCCPCASRSPTSARRRRWPWRW